MSNHSLAARPVVLRRGGALSASSRRTPPAGPPFPCERELEGPCPSEQQPGGRTANSEVLSPHHEIAILVMEDAPIIVPIERVAAILRIRT